MIYVSKRHSINAFQFNGQLIETPLWFDSALQLGFAQYTINPKEKYITLYDVNGGERKAYVGDWVCINHSGTLFPLSEEEFERGFRKVSIWDRVLKSVFGVKY